MASESTPAKDKASEWGLPLTWDGHEKRQYPFFVSAVEDIDVGGWDYMNESKSTAWVIIPYRSRNAFDNE